MFPSDSAEALAQFLSDRRIGAKVTAIDQIFAAVLAFYETVPALGLAAQPDSDMLLFQYGVFDWGEGEFFEMDITRQFITALHEDDDAISQLHCTMRFDATKELSVVQPSNTWCQSRTEIPDFRKRILTSPGYQAALAAQATGMAIRWEQV